MAILVKLVAVDTVFAAARAEDLSSRQLKQAAYSLIINRSDFFSKLSTSYTGGHG